jgi:predicted nucleic acid-binding protein
VPDPVLYDAVTLRHFGSISRFDLLEACHGSREHPRWVTGVYNEIRVAQRAGYAECRAILDWRWLGDPLEPDVDDLTSISRLKIALGNAGFSEEHEEDDARHHGEAESIHLAKRYGYYFVTDDNDAYRVARLRLPETHVLDTVDLLRVVVANGDITAREAVEVSTLIRTQGRSLRRPYERLLTPDDFLN